MCDAGSTLNSGLHSAGSTQTPKPSENMGNTPGLCSQDSFREPYPYPYADPKTQTPNPESMGNTCGLCSRDSFGEITSFLDFIFPVKVNAPDRVKVRVLNAHFRVRVKVTSHFLRFHFLCVESPHFYIEGLLPVSEGLCK